MTTLGERRKYKAERQRWTAQDMDEEFANFHWDRDMHEDIDANRLGKKRAESKDFLEIINNDSSWILRS